MFLELEVTPELLGRRVFRGILLREGNEIRFRRGSSGRCPYQLLTVVV
jgi:hypothetical protein